MNVENRCNFIMTTNSMNPIKREVGDRRYVEFTP